jgi:histidine triad (HIT) family protein
MSNCLFCKIVAKQIPSKILFEEDDLLAFHDINPGAPTHVLVIPKQHVSGLGDGASQHTELFGRLLLAAKRVAEETGIAQTGYRVVTNSGPDAGQSVFHLHVHVLGGRPLAWPPG